MEYFYIFGILWHEIQKSAARMRLRVAFLPSHCSKQPVKKPRKRKIRAQRQARRPDVLRCSDSTFSLMKNDFSTINNKRCFLCSEKHSAAKTKNTSKNATNQSNDHMQKKNRCALPPGAFFIAFYRIHYPCRIFRFISARSFIPKSNKKTEARIQGTDP